MRRIWLAFLLVLSVGFSVPSVALADDGLIDSFSGGLQTLVSPESVKVEETDSTPESVYLDSYEPVLVEEPVRSSREYDEDSTTVDYINGTLDEFNKVTWASASYSWLDSVRMFIGARYGSSTPQLFLIPAVGIVFMWWGVRKAIRMIKGAWYKGHASV